MSEWKQSSWHSKWCIGVVVLYSLYIVTNERRQMPRMTITLSDEIHQALKEASIRQHRPIAAIIEESLRFRGIKTQVHARTLVQAARARGDLSEDNALTLAVEETRKVRRGK